MVALSEAEAQRTAEVDMFVLSASPPQMVVQLLLESDFDVGVLTMRLKDGSVRKWGGAFNFARLGRGFPGVSLGSPGVSLGSLEGFGW